ncbi:hypothetical protein PUMCH_005069 [Australozyma saopauloensis]|uniref:Cyclin-like domain-containing protein n=1 Tax=Australozyma saopauloensis TaxID=291208 RepID=A0AAX4HHM2_9ASCO|nr:hypothetical protein PUMCH_005069 [[Candida] saopauloensis]
MSRLYGPPQVKAKPYSNVLEILESQANKKLISEYSTELETYIARLELVLKPNPLMIDLQPEIQWFMRPYLLDFLIELHTLFRLQPSTFFLCINIIDRYCAKRVVFKRHYQLVGCTALWIAGKYEDKKLRVPTLRELAVMCRLAFDEEMFVQMEMHILATIEWLLGHPTLEDRMQFAINEAGVFANVTPTKYSRPVASTAAQKMSAVAAVGRFFCELSLYDRFFMTIPTSLIAFTATIMAVNMLDIPATQSFVQDLLASILNHELQHSLPAGEDGENQPPLRGSPRLGGLNDLDEQTLLSAKKVAIALLLRTSTLSEVLNRKYARLGVIPVVLNFTNTHPRISETIYQRGGCVVDEDLEQLPSDLNFAADVLLNLAPRKDSAFSENSVLPPTPPLATSQVLIFSNMGSSACASPALRSDTNSIPAYSPVNNECSLNWQLPVPMSKIVQ